MTLHFLAGATRRHPSWHYARPQHAAAMQPAQRDALSQAELRRVVAAMID